MSFQIWPIFVQHEEIEQILLNLCSMQESQTYGVKTAWESKNQQDFIFLGELYL